MDLRKNLWVYKYNPETFDNIIFNEDIKPKLGKALDEMPNLLLYGSAGVGKGCFANIMIKKDNIDLGVFRAKQWCLKVLPSKTNSFIFTEIQRAFNLKLSKKDMAKLGEALKLNREKEQVSGIKVNSIDSIKGLEGKRCLFILTTDIIPYLIQENTPNNKMKNYLYVALTRAREELMFLVTREVEEKYSRELLIEKFEELKISYVG